MSSGSKFARGGGRGQFAPPQKRGVIPQRQAPSVKDRIVVVQGKDAAGSINVGNSHSSQEESYQLLASPSATTQPFAMMIRLTPELLDELKQAETEQNVLRMKFGANASGHMIQVGSENFKFSSAPEPGDLCDIYEQRSGENGQQLLVEAGSAWRKLSVQRILSASEKDRVKKRTAEAEKRQRLRKSILVDQNTQMIIPQGTPAEANGRKGSAKTKREPPPKKRRVETIQVLPTAAKPRPQPSVTPLTATQRNLSPATSPVSDPHNYSVKGIPVTQMSGMQPPKGRPPVVDGIAGSAPSKGSSSQKEKAQSTPVSESAPPAKTAAGSMTDLRNFLIGLLQENPKGVTMKAMEKAVAEGLPSNPGRKNIDKVIRTIATFHSPGKYLLNPGVEKGSYLEVTPVSVEKASDMGPREEEPFSAIHGEPVVEKETDDRTINRDLSNVAPPQRSSAKEASAQPVESELSDPKSHGSSPKQSGVDIKAASSGSDSSSSSGSGSDSDSESDSSDSESGSDSGSASGSGSDSGASSSSSDTTMDEDVDIMSDDDNENKSDTKGKVKAKEGKLISKDDSKGEDVFKEDKPRFAGEDITLKSQEPALVIEKIDICDEVEPTGDVQGNLIKEVFGPDEDVDVMPDTNVSPADAGLLGSGQSKPHDTPSSRYGKHVTSGSPGKMHVSQHEGRKTSSRDAQSKYEQVEKVARANEVDSRALKKVKTSNATLESTRQERIDMNVNMRTNNQGLQESKSPIRSGGLAKNMVKDNNTNFVEPEKRDSTKTKVSSDGVVMKGMLSIEASKNAHESSPMRSKDSLQKVGRPLTIEDSGGKQLPMKQQLNAEVRGSYVKVTQSKDKHVKGAEKHDSEKAPESSFKDKSPEDVSRAGVSANKNREGASKSHDEAGLGADIANQGTRGLRAEHMGFNGRDEDARGKEKASERSTTKATKGGEPSGRQTDLDMKDRQHKDSSSQRAGNKVVVQGSSRDLNQSSGYNREVNKSIRESANPSRPLKQADESRHIDAVERAGLKVEQAERPLKEVDSTRRLKDLAGKDSLKEAESVGRTSANGIASGFLPKEGKMTDNVHLDSGRSSHTGVANVVSQDLELGELREPPVDNEPFQMKKSYSRAEDSKSRRGYETTSRVISQKDSTSPDVERFPGFGRGLSDSVKQSPHKVGRDPLQCTQDIRTGKRRLEENESFETDRMPKRKVDLMQEKQSLQVKLDKLPTVPAKEDRREKLKSGSSDAREHGAGSSITASLEANRKKSSKELDDNKNSSFPKMKTTSTPVASKEKHREKAKADNFDGVGKKQTPQSSEVQGNEFFAPYEKKEPELRGPIENYEQYKEYCKEYKEKHPIYIQLNQSLESDKEEFEFLRKQINEAKCKDDKNKLVSLYGRVRKEYSHCHKRYRRMQSTFRLLHQELQAIKLRCKEYAEKVGQG